MMSRADRLVECTIPVLPVQDLKRSIAFYTEILEFRLDWGSGAKDTVCSVSRDGCAIMLQQSEVAGTPAWAWIGLEDDSLFDLYASRGVKVKQPPRNFSWAYEMKFEDPDGNVLWLGTEPKNDLPLEDRQES
ncbi:putative lactoylglutathione lyase [Roseimicrobium gellanilyticum]|uniref:Putative lactoylglutathione lyase n=1 Tax=Roseimicrobium gellanilyticum TaxID=748857 RepID=A0A366H2U9_9BACT|nr:VOC family protein [Roseimicrobium gellanilyticum]RBP36116.1 putative lactoylglutathione lyase [Roseimicrobium gellanilyticum]